MKKLISIILVIIMFVTMATGCTSTGNEVSTKGTSNNDGQKIQDDSKKDDSAQSEAKAKDNGEGELLLISRDDLDTLNPHLYKTSSTREFLQMIGGTLYKIMPSDSGSGYSLGCEMAESDPVKMDDDGKVWQIKVRDDAKWANGEALTAEDYEYSLKMLFDPLLLNDRTNVLEEANIFIENAIKYFSQNSKGIEVKWEEVGVKCLDGNIIEIKLEKPVDSASVKKCFSGSTTMPVYEELYEGGMSADKTETNYGTSLDKFMSSGPYIVSSWQKGAEFVATKNINYVLKDNIYLASIKYKIVSESGTAMQLFENGQLDNVALTSADMERYGEDPRVMEIPGTSTACIGINCINEANPILQNKKFRQALFFGTNREEIAKLTKGIPADYFITTEYVADINNGTMFRDTEEAKNILNENYSYDPEKAKQLLDEALNEAGIKKATVEVIYHDGNDSRKSVSEYLQKSYANLFGSDKIEIKLQAVPSKQLSEKLRDHVNNKNSFELGWIASSYNLLDPSSALLEWHKDTHRKKISYYDDEFSAIYDEIVALPLDDIKGRLELTAKAEKKLLDDAPFIPLYQSVAYELISARVKLPTEKYNSVLEFGWIWAKIVD